MAGWADERPMKTFQIHWRNGEIDAVKAQGINHSDGTRHIQFWRANQLILSVNGEDVRYVRDVTDGGLQ